MAQISRSLLDATSTLLLIEDLRRLAIRTAATTQSLGSDRNDCRDDYLAPNGFQSYDGAPRLVWRPSVRAMFQRADHLLDRECFRISGANHGADGADIPSTDGAGADFSQQQNRREITAQKSTGPLDRVASANIADARACGERSILCQFDVDRGPVRFVAVHHFYRSRSGLPVDHPYCFVKIGWSSFTGDPSVDHAADRTHLYYLASATGQLALPSSHSALLPSIVAW